MELEFKECEICEAKPGSPYLCKSCLHNRTVIERLKTKIDKKNKLLVAVEKILDIDE